MTRPYILCALLEHGPLTRAEVREITGWPPKAVEPALRQLLAAGLAEIEYRFRRPNLYRLAA